jgi:DNA topoisomerase-1
MHLIITEKHDAANKISSILFPDRVTERVNGVPVYRSPSLDAAAIGLAGHIVTLDFPQEYQKWSSIPPKSLINANILTVYDKKDIINALLMLSPKATRVTIATDFDREGELIGVEAYRILTKASKAKFDRVRYSSFTKQEIMKAFSSPADIDFNMAAAGECRQEIDLVWGAALTRFISLTGNKLGKDFLSVGRVQTPLLAIIVERDKEIKAFVSKPYREIVATIVKDTVKFLASHKKGRFDKKEEAEAIYKRLGRTAIIKGIKQETKKEPAPIPFNTTEFLKAANSIGFSAASAMQLAEELYIGGWISYPRTDNTVYPLTLDLKEILGLFKTSPEFAKSAFEILGQKSIIPSKGKVETKDHPPIYPVASAKRSETDDKHWKIYELIVRRFFATLSPPCEWETLKVDIDISGEPFITDGKRLTVPGWRKHYPYGMPKEEMLPSLITGEALPVQNLELLEKKTEPPKRYGQGKLIQIMEDLNLGTKATRHEALSKLYNRGYIDGNPPQPTAIGITLIDALKAHAAMITSPDMTGALEKDMDAITICRLKKQDVVKESKSMLQKIFVELESHSADIGRAIRQGSALDSEIGPCPKCGNPLLIRETKADKKKFIACSGFPNCRNTYNIPPGTIKFDKKVCEKHKLHLIKVTPNSAIDSEGKKIKGKPFEYGCPACKKEQAPQINYGAQNK